MIYLKIYIFIKYLLRTYLCVVAAAKPRPQPIPRVGGKTFRELLLRKNDFIYQYFKIFIYKKDPQ